MAQVGTGLTVTAYALYFGCWRSAGHSLRDAAGRAVWSADRPSDLPWGVPSMDTGLLKSGKVADAPDGKVYWTCGGADALWYAFYWWDRSVDSRPGSNSGFYVRGFGWPEPQSAFDYACARFPRVVARQKFPLALHLDIGG